MSLFDVLGSKPRLRILQELSSEPRYVSELADRIGMDGKSAVHHLEVLEEADVVESYRVGRRKYYRLQRSVELRAAPGPEGTFQLYTGELESQPDAPETDASSD